LRATLSVTLRQTELGQYGLGGESGFRGPDFGRGDTREPYATGISPAVLNPDNAAVNARLARDPALRKRVTVADFGFRVPTGRLDLGLPAKSKARVSGQDEPHRDG